MTGGPLLGPDTQPAILVSVTGWQPDPWAKALADYMPGRTILKTDVHGGFSGDLGPLQMVHHVLAWAPNGDLWPLLPQIRAIYSLGAGVEHILSSPGIPDVPIIRIVDPDLTGRMAEYVVWQVLDHHRRGAAYRRNQHRRVWHELPQPPASDVGVGILGLGEIGLACADILSRLGFNVRGWSRTKKSYPGITCFHGPVALPEFLSETDIAVAMLPLTPETAGLLNTTLFQNLRQNGPLEGPVLINAGRGGSQVEADIIKALDDGILAGASLDVFGAEPLPPESPLWSRPDIFVTPHCAAASDPVVLCRSIANQIRRVEAGQTPQNIVDQNRGY